MDWNAKMKQILLLAGDVAVFYAALLLTLILRYGRDYVDYTEFHFWPFTLVLTGWIVVLYITGLYDLRALKNDPIFLKQFGGVIAINAILAVAVFYLLPLGITPRTNLFIFLIISNLVLYIWRSFYNTAISSGKPTNRVLLVGYNNTAEEAARYIEKHTQLGYEIKFWMKEGLQDKEFDHLAQIIMSNDINLIIVPAHIKKNAKAARLIYQQITLGIEVIDLSGLYERIFRKVPLAELEEVWFLENLAKDYQLYEFFKRPLDLIATLILAVIFLPFSVIIALLVALTSRGPVILRQVRIGKNGRPFTLYKFRTMIADAEKNGPQFSVPGDKRSTPFGALLRRTHLDEVPQIINVFRGDLSLIGPRPERPEFVQQLQKEIPFYDLRHIVRPGITGWAQTHYRYGATAEDMYEKIQFDIYYLKNRGIILDIIIGLKTLKFFLVNFK